MMSAHTQETLQQPEDGPALAGREPEAKLSKKAKPKAVSESGSDYVASETGDHSDTVSRLSRDFDERSDLLSVDVQGDFSESRGGSDLDFPRGHVVKKPPNGFFLFSRERRPVLLLNNKKVSTAQISRLLGAEWKALEEVTKKVYLDQAKEMRANFRNANPEYRYKKKYSPVQIAPEPVQGHVKKLVRVSEHPQTYPLPVRVSGHPQPYPLPVTVSEQPQAYPLPVTVSEQPQPYPLSERVSEQPQPYSLSERASEQPQAYPLPVRIPEQSQAQEYPATATAFPVPATLAFPSPFSAPLDLGSSYYDPRLASPYPYPYPPSGSHGGAPMAPMAHAGFAYPMIPPLDRGHPMEIPISHHPISHPMSYLPHVPHATVPYLARHAPVPYLPPHLAGQPSPYLPTHPLVQKFYPGAPYPYSVPSYPYPPSFDDRRIPSESVRYAPYAIETSKSFETSTSKAFIDTLDARNKKKRNAKDPNAPKHPVSAFLFYLSDVRPQYTALFPGTTIGPMTKMISAAWKELSVDEKSKFVKLAEDDKKRYSRQMDVYLVQRTGKVHV